MGVGAHDAREQPGGRVVGGDHQRIEVEADDHLRRGARQTQTPADPLIGAIAPVQPVEQFLMVEQIVVHFVDHAAVHAHLVVLVAKLKVHGHAGVGDAEALDGVLHLGHRARLAGAIQRRDDVQSLPQAGKLARQLTGDVGQSAALGERLRLRGHEHHRAAAQPVQDLSQQPIAPRPPRPDRAQPVELRVPTQAALLVGVIQQPLQSLDDGVVLRRFVERQQLLVQEPGQPSRTRRAAGDLLIRERGIEPLA